MHKNDVPVYVFVALIVSIGFFAAEHTMMAVSNIGRLEAVAAVAASSSSAVRVSQPEAVALRDYAETKLSGATELTVAGRIEAYYAENKKFDSADTPLHFTLVSGRDVYQLHNLSGDLDSAIDGASVTVTGFALAKSAIKDLYVNLSPDTQARLRTVHAFPAAARGSGDRSTNTCANSFCSLVVLVDSTGTSSHLPTPTEIHDYIFNGRIKNAFLEESYGQTLIAGDVTDWITLSSNQNISPFFAPAEIDQYIANHNISLSNYQQLVFLINGGLQSVGGEGTIGVTTYWQGGTMYSIPVSLIGFSSYANNSNLTTSNGNLSYFDYLYVHETGHNLNALHDNLLNCKSGPLSLPSECMQVEYGNKYSVMGDGAYGGHFSVLQKLRVGWLRLTDMTFAWAGTHTMDPMENSGGTYLGIDGMHDGIPEFLAERRTSAGLDTRSAFPSINLNGAFLYRLNNAAAVASTDPFSWNALLVDTTPPAQSEGWYQSASDVVFKIPQAYNDVQDHIRFSQAANGNNTSIVLSAPLQTGQSCMKNPVKVFEPATNPGDTFTAQIAKQKWPAVAVPNPLPKSLVQTLHADVNAADAQVFLAKNIILFNDDYVPCGPGTYTFELVSAGVSLPLLSESSVTYEAWSGPHFQTVMAYLPVNGFTYGIQTITLKVTKQNDGSVFTRDLKFDLEQ